MIVLCPSCNTRYRHAAGCEAASTAHCSQCDERFPLQEAKRTYVLVPGALPVGMDDPSLAAKVRTPVADMAPADAAIEMPDAPQVAAPDMDAAPDVDGASRSEPGQGGGQVLIATAPAVLGAGLAYYVAGRQQLDPISLTALGAAVGLLIGWGCLLWIERKN